MSLVHYATDNNNSNSSINRPRVSLAKQKVKPQMNVMVSGLLLFPCGSSINKSLDRKRRNEKEEEEEEEEEERLLSRQQQQQQPQQKEKSFQPIE